MCHTKKKKLNGLDYNNLISKVCSQFTVHNRLPLIYIYIYTYLMNPCKVSLQLSCAMWPSAETMLEVSVIELGRHCSCWLCVGHGLDQVVQLSSSKIAIFKAADAKHRFALMVVRKSLSLPPLPVAPDVSYKES